ncbi:hypothetical protein ES703_73438 [subsurface metagenome]
MFFLKKTVPIPELKIIPLDLYLSALCIEQQGFLQEIPDTLLECPGIPENRTP